MGHGDRAVTSLERSWAELCDHWRRLGEIVAAEMPDEGPGQAEGFRHVARLVIAGLHHEVEFDDPGSPVLYRPIDAVSNWGGPNVDNVYLAAAVSAEHTYRLHADTVRPPRFILQTITGIWHLPGFAVLDERSSDDFTAAANGSLTVTVGGDGTDPNSMPLDPRADRIWLRQYGDGDSWSIERLDGSAPSADDADSLGHKLAAAGRWAEGALTYWSTFLRTLESQTEPNQLGAPAPAEGGAAQISYATGFFDLQPDQALLIDLAPPRAAYWSVQLYSAPWYEALDHRLGRSSINDRQARVGADGRVRLVVSATDPGVDNWLDTRGHDRGAIHLRAGWCTQAEAPHTRVVPLAEEHRG